MAQKKLYRNIIQYEILSEEKLSDRSLDIDTISSETKDGAWSGHGLKLIVSDEELTGEAAVKAVKEHGSDPEFFNMDDDGIDLDS